MVPPLPLVIKFNIDRAFSSSRCLQVAFGIIAKDSSGQSHCGVLEEWLRLRQFSLKLGPCE